MNRKNITIVSAIAVAAGFTTMYITGPKVKNNPAADTTTKRIFEGAYAITMVAIGVGVGANLMHIGIEKGTA